MTTGRMKAVAATALTVVTLLAASGAQATLSYRLNGKAVYDDVADLTWLQDANAEGAAMTWSTARAWASNLVIGEVADWRLPGGPIAFGYDQTASEMGNMFYAVLGGMAGQDIAGFHNENYDLFQNIQSWEPRGYYWSGVEYMPGYAWFFSFYDGYQIDTYNYNYMFAWAVHDGDVEASAVPAPGTLALLGAGFLGWMGIKRNRRAGA